jgi:hypothetical protein
MAIPAMIPMGSDELLDYIVCVILQVPEFNEN